MGTSYVLQAHLPGQFEMRQYAFFNYCLLHYDKLFLIAGATFVPNSSIDFIMSA